MRHRNLSVDRYFLELAEKHQPRYRFAGRTKADWETWRAELLPAVKASLGIMPTKVPLNGELLAEWREDGLIKQRVIFDVEAGLSATGYVFRPENAPGKLPAILCCHGHGGTAEGFWGKDGCMTARAHATAPLKEKIERNNYDYGVQMAQAGFVTMCIDWRGFGERDDRRKPHFHNLTNDENGDPCNVHYLRASLLGRTVLGMDVHDGMCAVDYLSALEFVDPARIGVMGLSFGGTMTTFLGLCDERLKAADIICYSDRFSDFAIRDNNACGSQVSPGLFNLCDVPDLQGLIAPRAVLVEIGTYDDCFLLDSAMSCWHEVEKIFGAAGVRDRLELDLFEGGHRWGGNKSVAFFRKWLAAD
jgi:dienelactone hydrolase